MLIYIEHADVAKAAKDANIAVEAKRRYIVKTLSDADSDQPIALVLNGLVNDLAEHEGAAEMLTSAATWLSHESAPSIAEVAAELTAQILNGPDDTWSGRGNDARRAKYEGRLEAVKAVRRAAK